MVVVYYRVIS